MIARARYVVLAAMVLPAAVAAESRPPYQGTATGSFLGAPSTLDPVRARTHAEITLVSNLFDTLYAAGEGGGAEPHLAASLPGVSGDGLEATIELRPGVRFHGGRELTAEDVAASLRRLKEGRAGWLLAPVRSIRAEEDAVVLALRRPTPELTLLLSAPQAAVTRAGRPPTAARPGGSGPFRLARLDRSRRRASFERFEEHFAGPPYLDRLVLRWFDASDEEARAYEAGRASLSLRGEVAFVGHRPKYRTELARGPATVLAYAGFCGAHPELVEKPAFRRALSLALGRDSFRNIGTGERVVPSIHPASPDLGGPATPKRLRRPRPGEARRVLGRIATEVEQLGSAKLEVLVDRSRPDDRDVGGKVVKALFKLGLSARIVEVAPKHFARRVERGRCDLYVGQLAAPAPEPVLQVAAAFAAGGDRWAAERLARGQLRLKPVLEAFSRRLPVIPLFHRAVRAHHWSNLRGVQFDGATRLSYADLFVFGDPEKP